MPGESKTSPRRLTAAERQRQAVELRLAGASFDAIATRLEYADRSGAYRSVMAALKRTQQEPTDELRRLNTERLNRMLLAIWSDVQKGNFGAIDRAVRILESEAKLLGLDAPAKQETTMILKPAEEMNSDEIRTALGLIRATLGGEPGPGGGATPPGQEKPG